MSADLAVIGASIRTMDPHQPFASAIAVKDGRILAVGDDAAVQDVCDRRTEVIDGRAWSVTPGLTDGHQHLFHGSELARGVSFDRVASLDEVRARLAAERARVGPGEWVVGYGLEYAALGGASYHHDLIDSAAGDGPCLILSLDLHTLFANAHAVRLAAVTGRETFDDASFLVCDEAGRPTGEAREMAAMFVFLGLRPEPTEAERLGWYADTISAQNAVGITGIHQMDGSLETARLLTELEASGRLGLRVQLHYLVEPTFDGDHLAGLASAGGAAGRRWRTHGVKFVMDGVIDTGTAWLEEPDSHGDGLDPMWPDHGRYRSAVRRFHDAGLAVTTHAIGDRAVREVLDTYGALPSGGRRHRIEHVETAPASTLRRFAPMGVTASMQPIHLRWLRPDLSDPWSERLGRPRCDHAMPSGDLSAAGALVVLGSDWPVAPYDPRLGFFAAQLRRAPDLADQGPIGASRPLTGLETLAGYTTNAARAVGEEGAAGVLKVGAQADLVAWGADPVTTPPTDVLELPCRLTVVDGTVVHREQA